MKLFSITSLTLLFIFLWGSCSNSANHRHDDCDRFVDDLLSQMTLEEKIGQTVLYTSGYDIITGPTVDPNNPKLAYGSKYWDVSNEPLYPFGYCLSYTTFTYSQLRLSSSVLTKDKPIEVTVEVTNSGKYDGEEVVQLYTRDLVASITRPVKELKGFQKIFLKAGESQTVNFELTVNDLRLYNSELDFIYEPGDFHLFVGGSSITELESKFILQ